MFVHRSRITDHYRRLAKSIGCYGEALELERDAVTRPGTQGLPRYTLRDAAGLAKAHILERADEYDHESALMTDD